MKKHFFISLLFAIMLSSTMSLADQYFCVSNMSTGFSYDKNLRRWESVDFNISENKYIISKISGGIYEVTETGGKNSTCHCDSDFNGFGYLNCDCALGKFKFNKLNGRFIMSYIGGYFNVLPEINQITDESSDTPHITIGVCSPFEIE
jgi:hypothetical protein